MPFYYETRPEEDQPPAPWHVKWQPYLLPAIKYTAFIVLFILVYLVLFRPIRKRVFQSLSVAAPALAAQAQPAEITAGNVPKAIQGAGSAVKEVSASEAPLAALPGSQDVPSAEASDIDEQIEREFMKEAQVFEAGARKYTVLRKRLTEQAKKEPEMVSQLIRIVDAREGLNGDDGTDCRNEKSGNSDGPAGR